MFLLLLCVEWSVTHRVSLWPYNLRLLIHIDSIFMMNPPFCESEIVTTLLCFYFHTISKNEKRGGTLFSSEALPVLYSSCWYVSFNRTGNIKPFRRHLCDCLNDLFKMKFNKQRKHDENFFRTCVAVLHCFVRIDVTLRELLCSEKGAV